MKVHVVEQGSPEWHALRLGIPTASAFDRIITPAKAEFSASARGYAIELVTETMLGMPVIDLSGVKAVQRGKELEPEAAQMYEFELGVNVSPVGFITTDDGRVGASPDLLVDDQPGAVELKCPLPHTHMAYLLDGFELKYLVQVQGQMMVGDLEWVDRYSYHPSLPPVRQRTTRDEPFIAKLRARLDQFLDLRDELMERAKSLGVVHALPPEGIDDKLDRIRRGNYVIRRGHYVSIPSPESIDERNPFMAG